MSDILRYKKICISCKHNIFKDDKDSVTIPECDLDNDVESTEYCDDYEKVER